MARGVSDDTYYVSTGGKIPVVWTVRVKASVFKVT